MIVGAFVRFPAAFFSAVWGGRLENLFLSFLSAGVNYCLAMGINFCRGLVYFVSDVLRFKDLIDKFLIFRMVVMYKIYYIFHL